MGSGNPACLAVSLCVIAVYCFLNQRFAAAGIVCLTLSLCFKPQDAGLIWLYFLLAGGILRKRALQTLTVVSALCIPMVLWVSISVASLGQRVVRDSADLLAAWGHQRSGPATAGGRGFYMITDLQTVFSFYRDNALFYNLASFAVCAPLLLLLLMRAARSRASETQHWLGVAAMAALSMLPVLHRQYDAKLILLAIPACAFLMAEGGRMRRWAMIVTTVAFVLNGEFTWMVLIAFFTKSIAATIVPFFVSLVLPVPMSLLLLGSFYLWVYAQRAKVTASQQASESASQRIGEAAS